MAQNRMILAAFHSCCVKRHNSVNFKKTNETAYLTEAEKERNMCEWSRGNFDFIVDELGVCADVA